MKNLDTPDSPIFETNGRGELEPSSFGLTKRERACIDLRIPESGDAELDALIEKARLQEVAAKFAQSLLAHGNGADDNLMNEAIGTADGFLYCLRERTDG
ncbi:hypothetical protein [Halomonas sp. N3-2A]|uniref:hypothetical protein n=1 Tax=Halomonas sp. N3-2A TaxID=2014541 RepID=UPI000B5B1125|nr:hypothetical protein [Halomonas sp. N3-2A]ASK18421.1 hypothetical protein CEK60_03455 [Halomonas sp. N3-2A]